MRDSYKDALGFSPYMPVSDLTPLSLPSLSLPDSYSDPQFLFWGVSSPAVLNDPCLCPFLLRGLYSLSVFQLKWWAAVKGDSKMLGASF